MLKICSDYYMKNLLAVTLASIICFVVYCVISLGDKDLAGDAMSSIASLIGSAGALGAAIWAGLYVKDQLAEMRRQTGSIAEDLEEARKLRWIELRKLVVSNSEVFANELRSSEIMTDAIYEEVLVDLSSYKGLLNVDEYRRITTFLEPYRQSILDFAHRADHEASFDEARISAVQAIKTFRARLRKGCRGSLDRPDLDGDAFVGEEMDKVISQFRQSQSQYHSVLKREIERQKEQAKLLLQRAYS